MRYSNRYSAGLKHFNIHETTVLLSSLFFTPRFSCSLFFSLSLAFHNFAVRTLCKSYRNKNPARRLLYFFRLVFRVWSASKRHVKTTKEQRVANFPSAIIGFHVVELRLSYANTRERTRLNATHARLIDMFTERLPWLDGAATIFAVARWFRGHILRTLGIIEVRLTPSVPVFRRAVAFRQSTLASRQVGGECCNVKIEKDPVREN